MPRNVTLQEQRRLHTHEPKSILVVGHPAEFDGDDDRSGSFERCRRNLHNPAILTFDELLQRARFLVKTDFERVWQSAAQANSMYDFSRGVIERIQSVRSHEVELMQLADLLIGAVAYANRGLAGNAGKEALVARMRKRSGYALTRTTLLREDKTNLFVWHPAPGLV